MISLQISEADNSLKLISNSSDSIALATKHLADAQGKVVSGYNQIDKGKKQIISGVNLMYSKLQEFDKQKNQILSKVQQLQTGLTSLKSVFLQISNALNKIAVSMQSMKRYFEGYRTTNIFHVPSEAIKSSSFEKALGSGIMNKDKTIAKIILILDTNPFTNKASIL